MNFEKMEMDPDNIIWQNNMIYRLEHLKEDYSKERLNTFVGYGIATNSNVPMFQRIKMETYDAASKEIQIKKKNTQK